MPIPQPGTDETREDFMSRCMGDEIMNREFPDESQRGAVCMRQWEKPEAGKALGISLARATSILAGILADRFGADLFPSAIDPDALRASRAGGDYPAIREDYGGSIFEALWGYVTATGRVDNYRVSARRAITRCFPAAFYAGYVDGGGGEESDPESDDWIASRTTDELVYLVELFDDLLEWRRSGDFSEESIVSRVEQWVRTLDSIYSEGRLRGAANKMLTWELGATETHCPTCARLVGGRHKAKWYLDRDYIPRKPDAAMDCHGYNCDCRLVDDDGNEITPGE